MHSALRFGIDLGGSKIEIIALQQDQTVLRKRCATPHGDYGQTLKSIGSLVQASELELGASASVGIGIPGARSASTGLIKNANSSCLIGQNLLGDLQHLLQRPIRLANDADCFALSEASDGAGAGANSVFGVILGTGVGGGIVINGRLLNGPNAIAGEWGHNPLPWRRTADGAVQRCYCGLDDCIETFLSGPGWAARSQLGMSAEAIAQAAAKGEARAVQALHVYAEQLARSLAGVINIIDPEVIVLGGGLSNIAALYDLLPPLLARYVFTDQLRTRLLPALHGDSSGVRGAAWLWP